MKNLGITLLFLFLLVPVMTSADTLLIDSISQTPANSADGILRPVRGMSMLQVEHKYGAPSNKLTAVGDPPITRWNYPHYSVYFEYQLVLTSVVNQ